MTHTSYVEVRSYELDSYNHVNNAVYLNYLEHARMEFLHAIGFDYVGLFDEGYMLYVSRIDIKYKYSAKLYERLSIECTPLKLGKLSGSFSQVIKNEQGIVCVEAEVTWACVDKNGKPSKVPEKYLVEGMKP
ncbi:acyl-CoA thioesterase [Treponema pedis]|uniref:acyl-CoA thioesterase n=1 Tax=Treponema pedis TaxID=409322 RepID=UPI00040BE4C2|nr:thioesterase family protein [Treponema pedis]